MKKKNLKTGKRAPELKRGKPVLVQRVVRARLRVNIKGAWSTWKRGEIVNVLACEIGKPGRRSVVMANVPADALEIIVGECPNDPDQRPGGKKT